MKTYMFKRVAALILNMEVKLMDELESEVKKLSDATDIILLPVESADTSNSIFISVSSDCYCRAHRLIEQHNGRDDPPSTEEQKIVSGCHIDNILWLIHLFLVREEFASGCEAVQEEMDSALTNEPTVEDCVDMLRSLIPFIGDSTDDVEQLIARYDRAADLRN